MDDNPPLGQHATYSVVGFCNPGRALVAADIIVDPCPYFIRGDVDGNGVTDGAVDTLFLLNWLFADGDEAALISDAVYLIFWAFAGGTQPPAPGPVQCGLDSSPTAPSCAMPLPASCL